MMEKTQKTQKTQKTVSYPLDLRWLAAVVKAESDESLDPLVNYLRHPATQPVHLGPGECWWLRQLLLRMQFKRKNPGRFTPLGRRSAEYKNEKGAERVRQLMRDEKLTVAAALDRVAQELPSWFGANAEGLARHIKRHGLGK